MLGPLVIGGFVAAPEVVDRLASEGVRDSKLLSPARRTQLFRRLAELGERRYLAFAPADVDRAVRLGRLNRLEAEGFARLIRTTRPDGVFLDACERNAERFGQEVAARARYSGPLDARNRADRDLPLVGAASIVAKVRRDAAIARLAATIPRPIGSGYPSDETTRDYLRETLAPGAEVPRWVRSSWRTTATVIAERTRTTLERYGP